jgi:hypothetical protein
VPFSAGPNPEWHESEKFVSHLSLQSDIEYNVGWVTNNLPTKFHTKLTGQIFLKQFFDTKSRGNCIYY